MGGAVIAGIGTTPFGEIPEKTGRELFAEASRGALEDAGLGGEDVDSLYYGNYMGEIAEKQGHQAPLMAAIAGVDGTEARRVENACASGGFAVADGVRALESDSIDVVLVGGMERMTHLDTADTTAALARAADELYEVRTGMTFPAAYALMARAYFESFGGDRSDLAAIAIKNHENAVPNPNAQFQFEISEEKVLDAPEIADPLGLYDACPISDGASAAVLVSEEFAHKHGIEGRAKVVGVGRGADDLALQERASLAETRAAHVAASEAYEEAGIGSEDIDLAEVHDCFTIAEAMAIESLGIVEEGEGITAASEGLTTADGDVPVNLSGGLKAKGHPVGATGVSQLVEMTKLLDNTHPNSDAVPDAEVGVTHNAGGTVASAVVHVLEGVQ